MPMIEIKKGNKTTYKLVPENYDPENKYATTEDAVQSDLTTSCRRLMSFSDIDPEVWNKIFNKQK